MPAVFVSHFTVGPEAIDPLGHVNNVNYVAWMQEIAIAHSSAQSWPMDRYLASRAAWVVRSHSITYERPAFAGETIEALTWVAGFGRLSSPRRYLFRRGGEVLAEAETVWAYIDLENGRPRTIPAELRGAFDILPADQEKALRSGA